MIYVLPVEFANKVPGLDEFEKQFFKMQPEGLFISQYEILNSSTNPLIRWKVTWILFAFMLR